VLELRTKADEIYSLLSDLGSGKAPKAQAEEWIATNLAKKNRRSNRGRMTAQPKKKPVEKVKIDNEFRRIAEKNLRKDRELLDRLAKI
jgi:hypothetical protein